MAKIRAVILSLLFLFTPPVQGQVRLAPETAQKLILVKPVPVYPEILKGLGLQGTAKVEITVSEKGIVTKATWIGGDPSFAPDAEDAVKKSKYRPYAPEGRPVPFVTVVDITFSLGIPQAEYDQEQKLASQYFKQEEKCRQLLNASKWQEAEKICGDNVPIANKLGLQRGLTKMMAYEHLGFSMLGQNKYNEALSHFNHALEFAKASLTESDAEFGDLYIYLGLTYSRMGNPNRAREQYAKGEKTLQLAYDRIGDSSLKKQYIAQLKRAIEYHISAAEAAGAKSEVQELRQRLAKLR
jgi:TonB family protein